MPGNIIDVQSFFIFILPWCVIVYIVYKCYFGHSQYRGVVIEDSDQQGKTWLFTAPVWLNADAAGSMHLIFRTGLKYYIGNKWQLKFIDTPMMLI